MMELAPRQEGLIHISELADERVGRVEDVVKVGDRVSAKVISIDEQGRVNLSRRQNSKENPLRRGSNHSQENYQPKHHKKYPSH